MTQGKAFAVRRLAAASLARSPILAAGAQAMPLAPLSGGRLIETAAGGRGPGFHPNPWGECRPNRGPRPGWGPGWRRPAAYGPYADPPPGPFYGRPGFDRPRPFD